MARQAAQARLLHFVAALRVTRHPPRWTGNCGRKQASGQELTDIDYHRSSPDRRVAGPSGSTGRLSGGQRRGVHIRAATPWPARSSTPGSRDDRSTTRAFAAYLGHLHEAAREPATAAMVVAAVERAARDAGTAVSIGPLTRPRRGLDLPPNTPPASGGVIPWMPFLNRRRRPPRRTGRDAEGHRGPHCEHRLRLVAVASRRIAQ